MAYTATSTLKQAVALIEGIRLRQIKQINERAERAISALQFLDEDESTPIKQESTPPGRDPAPICVNPDPKRCDDPYHAPECDSYRLDCEQQQQEERKDAGEGPPLCRWYDDGAEMLCSYLAGHHGDHKFSRSWPRVTPSLECKNCLTAIEHGNCCSESCTKEWMATMEKAHRDKSKGRSFCKNCGQPHELKSNYCRDCAAR